MNIQALIEIILVAIMAFFAITSAYESFVICGNFSRTQRHGRGNQARRSDPMRIRGPGNPRPTFQTNPIIQVGATILIAAIFAGILFAANQLINFTEWIRVLVFN